MAIITQTFSTEAQFRAAFDAIPADVVASGNSYRLLQTNTELTFANPFTFTGKNTGPSNGIEVSCVAGASYMDNANILTNPFIYSGTSGAAVKVQTGFFPALFIIEIGYVTFTGYQMKQGASNAGPVLKVNASNVTVDRCILDGSGGSQYDWPIEVNSDNFYMKSSLVIHRSEQSYAVRLNTKTAIIENCTFVRPSNHAYGNVVANLINGGNRFVNCAAFGFAQYFFGQDSDTVLLNSGGDGLTQIGTTNRPNLVAADQLVSPLNDFKLKTGSVLIDAGTTPSVDNTRAPNGVRQQGTAADIGAWEVPNSLVAPSATVTNISVSGQNATISGTTTGVPTSGTANVSPASFPYNSAEAKGPIALTLGSGTFSVVVPTLKVGKYDVQLQVTNAGYTSAGQNPIGSFDIVGAVATTLVQDPMGGQTLRISGNVSGSPTSGTLLVPAATSNPNGAFDQNKAVTITGGTYEVSIVLPSGNYGPGILRFTNAAGTSLPQAGTSAVSIVPMDGNPEAPANDGEPPPTPVVTSVTISPKTATGSIKFSAFAAGTDSPPQTFTYTATAGTIDNEGNYVAPAATSQVQTITVTATSTYDVTKSDTATVTIQPAASVMAVEIDLTTDGTTPAINLSNLKWAWFDQNTPNLFVAPTDKGVSESTDGSGVLRINLPNTTLTSGDVGWLIVTDSNGSVSSAHKAFSGPVTVI